MLWLIKDAVMSVVIPAILKEKTIGKIIRPEECIKLFYWNSCSGWSLKWWLEGIVNSENVKLARQSRIGYGRAIKTIIDHANGK